MDFNLYYLSLALIFRQMTCDSLNQSSSSTINSVVQSEYMAQMKSVTFAEDNGPQVKARPDVSRDNEPKWDPPTGLCDDPVIYTIDRMTNGSIWIYRDSYYWQLNGLPDNQTTLNGPFRVWWSGMAPVKPMTHVMTKTVGEKQDTTFRFRHDMFWAFNRNGMLYIGSPDHNLGKKIQVPTGGLTAVLFNHDKSNPLMIGFRGLNVYYYRFETMKWIIDGQSDGYVQGRYRENFPGDIGAAIAFPATNQIDGYIAYLFKGDKYCRRPERLQSGKTCDEWKYNRELFGCDRKLIKTSFKDDTVDDGLDVWPPDIDDKVLFDLKSPSNNSESIELSVGRLVWISLLILFKSYNLI